MSRPGRALAPGILLLATLASACGRERTSSAGEPARSESGSPAFPTDPTALASRLGVAPDSLRAAGEERYSRGAYDSARAIFEVEVSRAHAAGDLAAEGRAGTWLGNAAWRLGDYPAARREGEMALALKRRAGSTPSCHCRSMRWDSSPGTREDSATRSCYSIPPPPRPDATAT